MGRVDNVIHSFIQQIYTEGLLLVPENTVMSTTGLHNGDREQGQVVLNFIRETFTEHLL